MFHQRINRELEKISKNPLCGINLNLKEKDKLNELEAQIIGPVNTPYENGCFKLEILIPDRYPFNPPCIKFITKIYHPNIDDNGRICLDLIKMPPKGNWKPTIGLEGLLLAIRMLMENPNTEDPLMSDIAEEFLNNKKEFIDKATMFTNKYAN